MVHSLFMMDEAWHSPNRLFSDIKPKCKLSISSYDKERFENSFFRDS